MVGMRPKRWRAAPWGGGVWESAAGAPNPSEYSPEIKDLKRIIAQVYKPRVFDTSNLKIFSGDKKGLYLQTSVRGDKMENKKDPALD
jgi:hypothetical protein